VSGGIDLNFLPERPTIFSRRPRGRLRLSESAAARAHTSHQLSNIKLEVKRQWRFYC